MADSVHIPETVLVRIWEEQRFFPECLYTTTGLPVHVIRPGIRNLDAGPDFRSALIRIGDHTEEGDVELHLHLHDWQAHGHHTDPHYNHTVLHVVLWPPGHPTMTATPVYKANGESLPTVFVHHVLDESLSELVARFQDTDQQREYTRQHCRLHLHQIPPERLIATLKALGHERLDQRAQRFHEEFLAPLNHSDYGEADVEQALYEALCEGLGYAANKAPFRELARRLPLQTLIAHLPPVQSDIPSDHLLWIQAMLFGTSGLLQQMFTVSSDSPDPETGAYTEQLCALWDMLVPTLDVTPMSPEAWQFFRLRPANFPTRRIVALSELVLKYTVQPVFSHYLELFRFCLTHPGQETKQIRLFEGTLRLTISEYWQRRYRPGPPVKTSPDRHYLGISRIRDMLISAVFPAYLCYARAMELSDLETEIMRLYKRFPAPTWDHGTKTLYAQLFADHKIPVRVRNTAAVYQGLLDLGKRFCSLPACTGCPLATPAGSAGSPYTDEE